MPKCMRMMATERLEGLWKEGMAMDVWASFCGDSLKWRHHLLLLRICSVARGEWKWIGVTGTSPSPTLAEKHLSTLRMPLQRSGGWLLLSGCLLCLWQRCHIHTQKWHRLELFSQNRQRTNPSLTHHMVLVDICSAGKWRAFLSCTARPTHRDRRVIFTHLCYAIPLEVFLYPLPFWPACSGIRFPAVHAPKSQHSGCLCANRRSSDSFISFFFLCLRKNIETVLSAFCPAYPGNSNSF